jgi:hypothetical protein
MARALLLAGQAALCSVLSEGCLHLTAAMDTEKHPPVMQWYEAAD